MDFFQFDDEYVRRLREGDRETVEHYVDYFKLPLLRMLRRRGISLDDCEDVLQITHLRVIQELWNGKGIRDSHAFGAWVHTICTHVAQELERKRRETVELDPEQASKDEGALRELLLKEKKARVRQALQSLAKKEKRDADILRDLFFRDLDKDEICRNHGVDRDYLRVLIHRALKKFSNEYDDLNDS
jgi:RNA polymerase sigma-70 factor (ECF subfamily)